MLRTKPGARQPAVDVRAVLDPPSRRRGWRPSGRRGRLATWVLGVVAIAAFTGALIAAFGPGDNSTPPPLSTPRGLDVLPFPGTPDASPGSQIGFPALAPSELRAVTVRGSRSGSHTGRLIGLPDGRGSAFVPDRAFTASERVSVRAALSSPAAGTASGAPDATALDFAFTVATPPPSTMPSAATRNRASNPPPTQSFHSSSMRPPVAIVSGNDPDASSGDVFLGAATGAENGAMILDGRGRLVWFDPVPKGTVAEDVNEQSYRGKPVVTWWQGRVASGHGLGEDVIDNDSYRTVATVHAGKGYHADLHEFQITPQGTALITIYEPTRADLSSVGGPKDGVVLDSIVQEIDIKTGRVLWEWHALGHVPLSSSEAGKPDAGNQYDYFHVNAIQQLPDGNLLVSARNTWGVYEISRSTGKVIWTLGGKDSDFKPGPGTGFEWQHDARMQPGRDPDPVRRRRQPPAGEPIPRDPLTLNTTTLTASLDHAYTHIPPLLAQSQGSYQTLPNGNVFVGWGAEPDFSEYTPGGHQIFNVSFAPPDESYRALRSPMDRATDYPPVDRGQRHESRRPGRLRQLERSHQRRPLAADRGPKPEPAHTARPGGDPHRLRDRDRDHDLTALPRGRSARQLRTSAGHIDRPSRPRKDHDRLPEDSGSLDAEARHT